MNDRSALVEALAGRPVAKMNGAGNAIAILDLRGGDVALPGAAVRAIAAMPGLRFDQLMVLRDAPDADAALHIYNNDGSRAGACGNGTRCVAWFLLRDDRRDAVTLTAGTERLACRRLPDGRFSVDMGRPRFRWDTIPLRDAGLDPRALDLGYGLPPAFALSMGNPHAVIFVDDAQAHDLARIGPALEGHPAFPERANISFAQVIDPSAIRLRVWERGAGLTLACGTAACATAVAAVETGRAGRIVAIDLPGGRLDIAYGPDGRVLMTGPVEYEGTVMLDDAVLAGLAA